MLALCTERSCGVFAIFLWVAELASRFPQYDVLGIR